MEEVLIRQNQIDFIRREGFALQHVACELFKDQRGAVVLIVNDASKKIEASPGDFLKVDKIKPEKSFPAHVIKMVQEYNPEEEFVVVFLENKNQRVDGYRLKQNIKIR